LGGGSNVDSDKDLEIRSSKNYWEDIEPKMNKHAEILDLSRTMAKEDKKYYK